MDPNLRKIVLQAVSSMQEMRRRKQTNTFFKMYPDEDNLDDLGQNGEVLFHAREKYQKHLEFFEAGAKYRERCAMAANRVGKALRNSTPVATPTGWEYIGRLKFGDQVIAGDGSITTVKAVYPQGEVQLYRLTFDRGETIDCCGDHLWKIIPPAHRYPTRHSHGRAESNPRYGQWAVMSTEAMLEAWGEAPSTRQRCVMPTSGVWRLAGRTLPLHPYLMGVLLGDGGMTSDTVSLTTADEEIVSVIRGLLPTGSDVRSRPSSQYAYSLVKTQGKLNPIITALRNLGLMGERSEHKRIPADYLLSDHVDRLELLRGLMDTDGTISKTGTPQFCSTSRDLAEGVRHLVITLGGTARIKERVTRFGDKDGLPSFIVSIRIDQCPFRLTRKAMLWSPLKNTMDRVLRSIEKIDVDQATCIEVDHPDRTFVTDHGIVTHNSYGMGGYEMTCHLTGLYPKWWAGRRFSRPIRAWASGKTNETTRDIVQTILLGNMQKDEANRRFFDQTGLIPRGKLGSISWKRGLDIVDIAKVRHKSGGWSLLGFKSYEQGRGAFEGTAQHVIWNDEEPPLDIYSECLIRTATTNGITMITFTPLDGLSETVMQFVPQDQFAL